MKVAVYTLLSISWFIQLSEWGIYLLLCLRYILHLHLACCRVVPLCLHCHVRMCLRNLCNESIIVTRCSAVTEKKSGNIWMVHFSQSFRSSFSALVLKSIVSLLQWIICREMFFSAKMHFRGDLIVRRSVEQGSDPIAPSARGLPQPLPALSATFSRRHDLHFPNKKMTNACCRIISWSSRLTFFLQLL